MSVHNEHLRIPKGAIKECLDCGVRQLREDFPKSRLTAAGSQTYYSRCKFCLTKRRRPYHKGWRKDNKAPFKEWERQMIRSYGIDANEYHRMLKNQNGVCKICGKTEKRRLSVDHNHQTQQVRGLLCRICNSVLGFVNEEIIVFSKMIEYLEKDGDIQCQ